MSPLLNWGETAGKSVLVGYGVAVSTVALALGARYLLSPVLGNEMPFFLFLPGVFFTAWVGGFGPGFLATVLSSLAVAYVFSAPVGSLRISLPAEQPSLLLYVLICLVICWWIRARQALSGVDL